MHTSRLHLDKHRELARAGRKMCALQEEVKLLAPHGGAKTDGLYMDTYAGFLDHRHGWSTTGEGSPMAYRVA